jgi:hypothetical protein
MPIKVQDKPIPTHVKAFPKPAPDQVIGYFRATPLGPYYGFLVKITSWEPTTEKIRFLALTLADTSKTSKEYEVDLGDPEYAWRLLPSTVDGWDSGTNNHALLFLSDSYVRGDGKQAAKPDLNPALMGDPTKWPKYAGDYEEKLEHLTAKVERLEEKVESQKQIIQAMSGLLGKDEMNQVKAQFGDIL